MKERFDKTKSNDDFISNSNATYQDQLNKQKFFRGYNNNQYNNLSGINEIPNNKMNILHNKPNQIEQLDSNFNYKVICVIIIMILFFGVISFLIVYFILTKINKINNYITYDCYTSEDNPYINQKFLNEHEGKINIKINEMPKSLRQINEGEGKKMINVKIKIDYKLSNFSKMFEGCKDIINIDLSKIEGSIIKDMSNLFKDCSDLEIVNFGNLDTSKVTSMNNLFKGCTNLSEIIGLENINTSHLNTINGMFAGCKQLYYVNLSSFNLDNIIEKKWIFDKNDILTYVDLRNSKNINISEIFKEEFFKDRNVYILVDDNSNLEYNESSSWLNISKDSSITCNIGGGEQCKSCKKDNDLTCKDCNDGYYLTNSKIYSKNKCRKCKDKCNKCHDDEYGEVFCDIDELIDSSTTDENIDDSEEPSDSDSDSIE